MIHTLKALIGLNWTLFRNALFPGKSKTGYKPAIPPRKQGNRLFIILMFIIFLSQGFFLSHEITSKAKIRIYENEHPNKVLVDRALLESIENKSTSEPTEDISDEMILDEIISDDFVLVETNLNRETYGFKDLIMEDVQVHFEQYGHSGFYFIDDVEHYTELSVYKYGSYIFYLLCFIFVCLLFNSLSSHLLLIKQQTGKDDMFKYLPVKGSVVLLGGFFSKSMMRILAWFTVFPLVTVVINSLGYSYGIAIPSAIAFTLFFSSMISGVEIVLDTWLRYAAPKRVVNAFQKIFAILGVLSIYTLMAVFYSRSVEQWIYEKVTPFLSEGNFLGWVFEHDQNLILLISISLIGAIVAGVFGCNISGKILDGGITYSLNEQNARVLEHDVEEKSLWDFEKLTLLRNRGIATQILIIPFVFIAFQIFTNPEVTQDVKFRSLCALGVGSGAYACILTISRIFTIEQKGLWIIQTLPCDISDYFNRRERLWRIVGSFVGGVIIIFGLFWRQAFSADQITLAILSLVGVWTVGRVVNGIMMGSPELSMNEEKPNTFTPKTGKMYLAMLVAGVFTTLVYKENLWGLCVANFICWLLGQAIWERQRVCYRYMFDPSEKAPKVWSVSTSLWLVVAFFSFQTLGLILFMDLPSPAWTLLSSFVFGGLFTLILSTWLNARMSKPLPSMSEGVLKGSMAIAATVGGAGICLAIAQLWLSLLHQIGISLPESDVYLFQQWPMLVLIVVAAPLLEEPIFRGKIFKVMKTTWSVKKSMIVSSLLFAVVHPGFSFLPVFCVGLTCAWLYQKTGKLTYSILLHALYNFGVVCYS